MDVNSALTQAVPAAKLTQAASDPVSEPVSAAHATAAETEPIKTAQNASNEKANGEKVNGKDDEQITASEQYNLDKSLEQINKSLASFNRHLQKSYHDKLNRVMVKVVDTEQDKVIREIPPEKVLDAFAKALEMAGVLLDVKQ